MSFRCWIAPPFLLLTVAVIATSAATGCVSTPGRQTVTPSQPAIVQQGGVNAAVQPVVTTSQPAAPVQQGVGNVSYRSEYGWKDFLFDLAREGVWFVVVLLLLGLLRGCMRRSHEREMSRIRGKR